MVPDLFTGLLKLAHSSFIYFFSFPSFHLFAWICRGACGGFWGEVLYCFHKCLVHQRGYPHHTLKQTEVTYFFPCFWGLYFYFSQDFVCRAVIVTEVSPVRPQSPGVRLSGWTMFPLSHSRELHSLHPARCLLACRGERNNLFKQRVRRKGKKKKKLHHFSISNYCLFVWPSANIISAAGLLFFLFPLIFQSPFWAYPFTSKLANRWAAPDKIPLGPLWVPKVAAYTWLFPQMTGYKISASMEAVRCSSPKVTSPRSVQGFASR